jgi:hypothetical protein
MSCAFCAFFAAGPYKFVDCCPVFWRPIGPIIYRLAEKGEPERAASELESHLKKNPQLKNAVAIQNEIKRLRDKARASKP